MLRHDEPETWAETLTGVAFAILVVCAVGVAFVVLPGDEEMQPTREPLAIACQRGSVATVICEDTEPDDESDVETRDAQAPQTWRETLRGE